MKRALRLSVTGAVLLLVACSSPLARVDVAGIRGGGGRLTVAVGIWGARTVIPDFTTAIDSFAVLLTSHDGYAAKSATVEVPATSCTFDSVETGIWDITVNAEKNGSTVAAGSAAGQTIGSGATLTVIVPLTFSQSGGTGELSLAISFPASTEIDYVEGAIDAGAPMVPILSEAAGQLSGVFEQGGLAVGTHDLVLTFKRGGAAGTAASVFREAVNIWENVTSDMWIDPSGQPVAVRTYTAQEFKDASTSLADLWISNGVIGFVPTTTTYDAGVVTAEQLSMVATESISGQYIRYRAGTADWTELRSEVPSAAIPLEPGPNTIQVWVTAPDRVTSATYTIEIRRGFSVIYDGNSSISGAAPVDSSTYLPAQTAVVLGPGTLASTTYTFVGWNTAADGSGTEFAEGTSITIGNSAVTLFAEWQVAAPTFSPAGGTYDGARTVAISSATPAASIRYTLDGSDPTPVDGTLGSSVEITETSTMKAVAFEPGRHVSTISEASYLLTGGVTVTFTLNTPDFQTITFQAANISVARGDTLRLTTTNELLVGLSNWKWYVDDWLDPTQTSSSFAWDTTGTQPGQYIINVTVVYDGVEHSGSLKATVTY